MPPSTRYTRHSGGNIVQTQVVLTLIGPDRPGLIEALSDEIARASGNWEQSRMARLADQFAGILRVSLPTSRVADLTTALKSLERHGLRIVVEASQASDTPRGTVAMRLEVVGNDRAGIVRDISRALAQRSVNVDELETQVEEAPMGGGQLFRARALLHAPQALTISQLRAALEGIADDLMVDVSLATRADDGTKP
jgi:glycine cleavage system regulatory protein